MPAFHKNLDVYQGYDFKKDRQTPVGFLTKLEVGDLTLPADQTCKAPTDPAVDLKAVAVLSGIGGWSGIGVAADMSLEDPTAGLGAIGAFKDLASFSNQGGVLTVFSLP